MNFSMIFSLYHQINNMDMIFKNVVSALAITQKVFVCLIFSKAMEKVMNSKVMIEAIGEPIEKGPWYNASLAVSHQRHSVSCSFPVIGPQGTGILHLKAVRNGGKHSQTRTVTQRQNICVRYLHLPFFLLIGSPFLLGIEDSMFGFLQQRDWDILIMDALVHVPSNEGPQQTLRINVTDIVDPSPGTHDKPLEPLEPEKS